MVKQKTGDASRFFRRVLDSSAPKSRALQNDGRKIGGRF